MHFIKKYSLYLAWTIALVASLGSLYYSDIKNYAPCVLCWYQRVAMYPLVLIIAAGIYERHRDVSDYALPFSIVGTFIAFYQNLLYYGVLPESIQPCAFGVSCTTKYVSYFGFISIPLLALVAFLAITALLIIYRRRNAHE